MKVLKSSNHLGQSLSFGLLLVLASMGIFALMTLQTQGF